MVFVTGGTGLLGSHLLIELTKQHNEITAIYRNAAKIEQTKKCFDYYLKEQSNHYFEKITWKECDILDVPKLEECLSNHQIVYHCAGFVSYKKSDFSKLLEVNRYGTANMVNVSLALNIEKFCFVSSTAAVGNKDIPENVEINEDGKWVLTKGIGGYSISKYSAEKEVWRGMNEGLNAVIVNPSIIFGAGNWKDGSLKIFETIKKGLKFYPPGQNAFVDARDVAKIMVQLMNKNIFNERFLCIGENASFYNLFTLIAKQINLPPPKYKVPHFLSSIVWRLAAIASFITFSKTAITKKTTESSFKTMKYSNTKIRKTLDYKFYSLKETVENTVKGKLS